MAKTTVDAGTFADSTAEIELKDPRLAAFLAWLVPGLGHIYQGRTGKGILFSICILGTFFYGMYIGSGRVVYASTADVFSRKFLSDRWQYACQIGVGLPALPALVQRARVNAHKPPLSFPLVGDYMRPPQEGNTFRSEDQSDRTHEVISPDELSEWSYDYGEHFEIGTVFTVIAGLLNILVIFDAYGGPLVILPPEDKNKDDDKNKKS